MRYLLDTLSGALFLWLWLVVFMVLCAIAAIQLASGMLTRPWSRAFNAHKSRPAKSPCRMPKSP